jgi:hypothetical protein
VGDNDMTNGSQERTSSWRKPLLRTGVAVALVLLLPAVAMQFSAEIAWGLEDFLVAGLLLFVTGLLASFALRRVVGGGRRVAVLLGLAFALAAVWAELAVGLFD